MKSRTGQAVVAFGVAALLLLVAASGAAAAQEDLDNYSLTDEGDYPYYQGAQDAADFSSGQAVSLVPGCREENVGPLLSTVRQQAPLTFDCYVVTEQSGGDSALWAWDEIQAIGKDISTDAYTVENSVQMLPERLANQARVAYREEAQESENRTAAINAAYDRIDNESDSVAKTIYGHSERAVRRSIKTFRATGDVELFVGSNPRFDVRFHNVSLPSGEERNATYIYASQDTGTHAVYDPLGVESGGSGSVVSGGNCGSREGTCSPMHDTSSLDSGFGQVSVSWNSHDGSLNHERPRGEPFSNLWTDTHDARDEARTEISSLHANTTLEDWLSGNLSTPSPGEWTSEYAQDGEPGWAAMELIQGGADVDVEDAITIEVTGATGRHDDNGTFTGLVGANRALAANISEGRSFTQGNTLDLDDRPGRLVLQETNTTSYFWSTGTIEFVVVEDSIEFEDRSLVDSNLTETYDEWDQQQQDLENASLWNQGPEIAPPLEDNPTILIAIVAGLVVLLIAGVAAWRLSKGG